MKVLLESSVECTIDGVGLLEPGKAVEVDVPLFQMYHHVSPAEANFPPSIKVTYSTEEDLAVESPTAEEEVN